MVVLPSTEFSEYGFQLLQSLSLGLRSQSLSCADGVSSPSPFPGYLPPSPRRRRTSSYPPSSLWRVPTWSVTNWIIPQRHLSSSYSSSSTSGKESRRSGQVSGEEACGSGTGGLYYEGASACNQEVHTVSQWEEEEEEEEEEGEKGREGIGGEREEGYFQFCLSVLGTSWCRWMRMH